MRIAIVSTPFIRVPPTGYGGTELFCYELAEGLSARGHEVTLFATGDSLVTCRLRALYAVPVWPPIPEDEANHVAWALSEIAREGGVDLVHLNSLIGIPMTRFVGMPAVQTMHHARCEASSRIYARHPEVTVVAISERQRSLEVPLARSCVIHHGISPSCYPASLADEGYLAHLGRYSEEKGTHLAIDIAGAAGMPLRLAGRAHPKDKAYFDAEVAPRMCATGVADLGEADAARKVALLRGARALVCPLQWDEPFGLIAIEAMLCGTPVLGFRRGSFPEIVDEGVTGFLAEPDDVTALAVIARGLKGFNRAACAQRARARFSASVMVSKYESLYRRVLDERRAEEQRAA